MHFEEMVSQMFDCVSVLLEDSGEDDFDVNIVLNYFKLHMEILERKKNKHMTKVESSIENSIERLFSLTTVIKYILNKCLPRGYTEHINLIEQFETQIESVKDENIVEQQMVTYEEDPEVFNEEIDEVAESKDDNDLDRRPLKLKINAKGYEHHSILCIVCDEEFETKNDLNEHLEQHHKNKNCNFKCDDCPETFSDKLIWFQHVFSEHKLGSFYCCPQCDAIFNNGRILVQHVNVEHNANIALDQCPICTKHLRTDGKKMRNEHVEGHMDQCHTNIKFKCKICIGENTENNVKKVRIYPSLISLKIHMKYQHGARKKKFPCHICGKVLLTNATSLKNHILKHSTTESNFSCIDCGKKFKTEFDLKTHITSFHENPLLYCEFCDYKTRFPRTFRRHQVCHSDERNYKCDQCDYIAKSPDVLNGHIKYVHLQVRNFICKFCNKAFKSSNHLKKHVMLHTGQCDYSCHICDKKYIQKSNLKLHLSKTHNQF